MNTTKLSFALATCVAFGACSQSSAQPEAQPDAQAAKWETQTPMNEPLAGEQVSATSVKVVVQNVDQEKRLISVKTPEDTVVTMKAGPEVKRLAEIKPGDAVTLRYIQSLAYEVRPATREELKAPMTADVLAGRNDKELPPGGGVAAMVKQIVTISAIDKKAPSVTIKNAAGETTVVPVKRPENLDRIKVGDHAAITYLEAVAIEVEPEQR